MTAPLTTYSHAGLTFDVTDAGDPRAQAVVLLHGFPANRGCWDDVSRLLVAAGLRTLAPDQRGYSPGARPTTGYPQAYATSALTSDVVALLDAAGLDKVHLVGHDWGGAAAWSVAGSHPDRITSLTVLSTPHPAALARALRSPSQAMHSSYMAFFQVPTVPEVVLQRRLVPWLTSSGLPLPVAQGYAGRMREPGALRGALGWYRAMRHSRGSVHRCRVPTTLVWGMHDRFLGRKAVEGTRQMVVADYEFVEVDASHWLPETHPELCAQHILERVRSV